MSEMNMNTDKNKDNHYPFVLKPLPYAYDALEPFIDTKTMTVHHDGHLKTYVDNLNKALEPYSDYHNVNLDILLKNISKLPLKIQTPVLNNGGGVYNHNLYFNSLAPKGTGDLQDDMPLKKAIDANFGSVEGFKKALKQNALSVFGSGYSFLVLTPKRKLEIINTPNQNTVLPAGYYPLLALDVWEHAYYLKHQNKRGDYIDDYFNVINFKNASDRYNEATSTFNGVNKVRLY